MPAQSKGHCRFRGSYEYFTRENGDLFKAPLSDVIMPDGRRTGRWVCYSHDAADVLRRMEIPRSPS
jgi:hypothetical protein